MNELKSILAVFIGGGLGALVRYSFSIVVVSRFQKFLPLATLTANLTAILIMGLALYYAGHKFEAYPWLRTFVLVGFCGGLSTFSAFSYETVLLLKGYPLRYALGNIMVSIILGVAMLYPFVHEIKR